MAQLSGVVLIDKPVGPTSHDVVAAVRRAVGQKRVGHAGTLDPLADGLLLVMLGPATRLSEYLSGHDKTYEVEAKLGVETDTYDAEGQVTARWEGPLPTDEELSRAVSRFVGSFSQTPPSFSAVKVQGRPLYHMARLGKALQAPARPVTIYSLEWTRPASDLVSLRVCCSAGTYIRSLVHDLGASLGCGAHVTRLRRTRSGAFSVKQAVPLPEALARLAVQDRRLLLNPLAVLPHWPRVYLDAQAVAALRLGRAVSGPAPGAEALHLAVGPDDDVAAVVEWDREHELWRPHKVFTQEIAG